MEKTNRFSGEVIKEPDFLNDKLKEEAEDVINNGQEEFKQTMARKGVKLVTILGENFTELKELIEMAFEDRSKIDMGTVIVAVAAMIYVFIPTDAILDIMPGLGMVDDAAVVATALAYIRSRME